MVYLAIVLHLILQKDPGSEPQTGQSRAGQSAIVSPYDDTLGNALDCSRCKFIINENTNVVDGTVLGVQPGDTICLSAEKLYQRSLKFVNIEGTEDNPVIFTNCGGPASVTVPGNLTYVIKFERSKYFRISGISDDDTYGLKFAGAAKLGITLDQLTTDFEVDRIEICNIGFAGIMAKTDPNCDDATIRGNFTLKNALIHHNFIHDVGGEGLYIGNSFYSKGFSTDCGTRYPHDLENIKIHHNVIRNSGWESIQLGGAVKGAEIYSNILEDYGQANVNGQNNGIQIGEGTGGLCYNNYIHSGTGNGIIVLGLGDNIIFNNIIVNAGGFGIFCDERYTPGSGFSFINNTIVHPQQDGIRLYADNVQLNSVINNLIVGPGSYDAYELDKTQRIGMDAYLYLLNSNVKVNKSNNYFTREPIGEFEKPAIVRLNLFTGTTDCGLQFKLTKKPPIIDNGKDVTSFGITFDFFMNPRIAGKGCDIGAIEYLP